MKILVLFLLAIMATDSLDTVRDALEVSEWLLWQNVHQKVCFYASVSKRAK